MVIALLLSGVIVAQLPPVADRPPESVVQVRETALAVFDAALQQDWPAASERVRMLNHAITLLPRDETKPDITAQLRGRMLALQRAVESRLATAAAADANWVARLAEEIAASYEPALPPDMRLLGFFGRALEVDAAADARRKANTDLADLRTVWRRVEPTVLQCDGTDAARTFSDALVGLDGAISGGDLASAARAEIAAAERVVAVCRPGMAHGR
jgi:hypothetical protein